MNLNPIGLAIPIFFLLIGLELLLSHVKNKKVYRFNDTMTDLGCGVGDQLLGLFTKFFTVGLYTITYSLTAQYELSITNAWVWIVGFMAVDFFYYWFHRESHLLNVLWACHQVHHQSEEYNLAVALRQPWFAKFFAWVFYLPLAVIGIPPVVFIISYSFNLLYQFWIHTRLIDRLGPLELILNTPSHHRVHHGINERYLDKNYAGVFIIWDRIFGSFQREEDWDIPRYGVRKAIKSWNPLWVNVAPFLQIWKDIRSTPNWKHKLQYLWDAPGWQPPTSPRSPSVEDYGYDTDTPVAHPYIMYNHGLLGVLMIGLLLFDPKEYGAASPFPMPLVLAAATLTVSTAIGWGGLLENRVWVKTAEFLRNCGLMALAIYLFTIYPSVYTAIGIGSCALAFAFFFYLIPRLPKTVMPQTAVESHALGK